MLLYTGEWINTVQVYNALNKRYKEIGTVVDFKPGVVFEDEFEVEFPDGEKQWFARGWLRRIN